MMKPVILTARIVFALLIASGALAQTHPTHDDKIAVFGTLHAHSTLSGDVDYGDGLTAREAFDYARVNGLDFLGVSDHHQESAGDFHLEASDYVDSLLTVAQELNVEHAGEFVAIPGIEWGITSVGNHINVFGAPTLPENLDGDSDYAGLYDWIAAHALFAQGNHPYGWKRSSSNTNQVGNYGRDLFADSATFAARADGSLSLMSIICRPSSPSATKAKSPSLSCAELERATKAKIAKL